MLRKVFVFSVLVLSFIHPRLGFAAPDWAPDPSNSRWIALGEKAESNGVFQLDTTSEGTVQPTTRAGRPCWEVMPTPKEKGGGGGRYWYFHVGDWNDWAKWIGEKDIEITLVYYDGKPANIIFAYDSSDPTVLLIPTQPGAWRQPVELKNGLELKGTGEWKTMAIFLPMALFQKRCNGGDFRFGPVPKECDFALAGVAVTRVPHHETGATVAERLDLPVSFVKSEGVVIESRRVRFPAKYVQEPGKPIVIEAENATSLQTDGRGELGIDKTPTGRGGAYIQFVLGADYQFTVKTPGKYQAWERARFPFPGSWNHSEMIGTQSAVVYDSNNGAANVWTWVKAGTYDLKAGDQRLQLSYMGGAQLDQIVIVPADAPAPMEPLPASPNVGPTQGWAETGDLRPLDVKKWLEFSAEQSLVGTGDAVILSFSDDGGKTFQPLPANRDLGSISAVGSGRDRLRFRAEFKASAGDPLPFLQNVKVAYAPGPHNEVTLANEAASLTFNSGGLVAMKHLTTNHSYTRPGAQAPLFILGLKKPGPAPLQEVNSAAGSLEGYDLKDVGESKRLDLNYRMANGMTIVAHITLEPSGISRWTMDITNPTDLEVAELEYPILPGVRLGDDPSDDTLFFPRCWGQVWKNPVSLNLGGYWGPTMRWLDLWDKTDGLYVGIHDDAINDSFLGASPDSATSLKIPVRQRIYVKPKGAWTSGQRVVAFHGGDWHEGADIYKAYIAKALKRSDAAEWARWIDTWGTQDSNYLPCKGWGVLPEDGDRLTSEGINFMAANRQMMDGMDAGYCGLYLYPALGWGTTRELAQQLAALRRRGLHYTPYMNWFVWAPGYGHYPRCGITAWKAMPPDAPRRDDAWWSKVAARNYDGSFPAVVTDRYAELTADIGAPEWRERLAYWTRRYLEWGADGMYYDQFNYPQFSGRLPKDYNTYGFWVPATLDTLRKIKDEARKTDPYFVSSGELYMDTLGQALDLHMTSGVINRLEFYAYCNSDQIFIDGGWNGGLAEAFGGHERERFIWQVGGRFEQLLGPEPWRSQILALRRRVKSLLYRSEFRDTVGLTIRNAKGEVMEPEPAVHQSGGSEHAPYRGMVGRWFLFKEGQQRAAMINLINTPLDDTATLSIKADEFGPVRAAWAFTLEGKLLRIEGQQHGDLYQFTLPKAEMASIVLVNRVAPIVQWTVEDPDSLGTGQTLTGGETGSFKLSLTNLDPEPSVATLTLRPPKGWAVSSQKVGPIPSGEVQDATLPMRIPPNAKLGRHDVHADVVTSGGRFSAYSMVVVAEPVIAEFRGDPGTYHLLIKNLTDKATQGTVQVTAPAPLHVTAAAEFELPAKGEVKVPVNVEGQDKLQQISEVNAKIITPLAKWDLVRGVMPIVANGDFEMDTAGDMRPDWWMGRKLADEWDPDHIGLESGGPSGKYCLRVDPSDDPKGFVRAYTVNGAIKPNTKYRISGWIKRVDPNGDVYIAFAGLGWRTLGTKEVGKWVHLEAEATSSPDARYMEVDCRNYSRQPAWFDGIKVEERP